MNSITQDMRYRQSLMEYTRKYGVTRASRKYNKNRSYIYFWQTRYDGSIESLHPHSKRPHSHPHQHTQVEIKLIQDMRRRNPTLGMIELWHRMRLRGYTRCPERLYRTMRKLGLFPKAKPKKKYKAKPYEAMTHAGERIQVDVKVVPRRCMADPTLKLYQYTAIDEYSTLRFLGAYPEQSTYSSADFITHAVEWFRRRGVVVECVQTDNGFEFTNRFSNSKRDLPTLFEATLVANGICHKLIRLTPQGITARWNAATVKTRNVSTIPITSTHWTILVGSSLPTKIGATIFPCDRSAGFRLVSSFASTLSNMFDKPTCSHC